MREYISCFYIGLYLKCLTICSIVSTIYIGQFGDWTAQHIFSYSTFKGIRRDLSSPNAVNVFRVTICGSSHKFGLRRQDTTRGE